MILKSTREREKRSIQRRRQIAIIAFQMLLLLGFLLTVSILKAIPHLPVPFAAVIPCLAPLFMFGPILLAIILAIGAIGPFMQKTQRQKQNWLNEYGLYILASVTQYPEQGALVIGGSSKNKNASHHIYLNWQDPQTGQSYSFSVNTRYSSKLRKLSDGDLYPLQFDPYDPSFFSFPLPHGTKRFKRG